MTARPRRPRLYFSFRSPYSWLTVHRLLRAVPDAAEAIDWLPYWDPDPDSSAALAEAGGQFHYVQMSRAKHLYLLVDTKRLARELGVAMAWPVDVDCWWELPHLAYLAAREQGRALPFYLRITEARWGRGEDVCTPEVVHAAAVAAGVDPERAVAAPGDPELRRQAVACLRSAYDDDVFGIPYLRWGRHRYFGYERLGLFLRDWRGITEPAAGEQAPPPEPANGPDAGPGTDRPAAGPDPVAVGAGYDTDTPGGCG